MTQALIVQKQEIFVVPTIPRPRRRSGFTVQEIFDWYQEKGMPRFSNDERHCIRSAMRHALELFGDTPAAEFGPMKLRIVREAMIAAGWTRRYINHSVNRLRGVFRFAASWEMILISVPEALKTLKGLTGGESTARVNEPRSAVPQADIQRVRAKVKPMDRDLMDLMLLTGCRSGELFLLTTALIDRRGDVWRVDLVKHKTAHRGKRRFILFNADAQAILLKYLRDDNPDEPLFHGNRTDFGRRVKKACLRAGVPVFTPHWLRHTVATRLVDTVGLEAAQQLLGHCGAAMTELYSRAAVKQATRAAKALANGWDESQVADDDPIEVVRLKLVDPPGPVPLDQKPIWTAADVLEATSISVTTLNRMVRGELLPCQRMGRQMFFDPETVKAVFLEMAGNRAQNLKAAVERIRKTPERSGKPWTSYDDRILLELTDQQAARKLNRSVNSCESRRKRLLTKRKTA